MEIVFLISIISEVWTPAPLQKITLAFQIAILSTSSSDISSRRRS